MFREDFLEENSERIVTKDFHFDGSEFEEGTITLQWREGVRGDIKALASERSQLFVAGLEYRNRIIFRVP